jgi:hypothetical protein
MDAVADTDTVVDGVPEGTAAGAKDTVSPEGTDSAVRFTVPEKPPVRPTEAVTEDEPPCTTESTAAGSVRSKS